MTLLETLQAAVTAYPIAPQTIEAWAAYWDVDLQQEASKQTMQSKGYQMVKANLWDWLAVAPNLSQGGQTYSFTDEQRTLFKQRASSIRSSVELDPDEQPAATSLYGYKGSTL